MREHLYIKIYGFIPTFSEFRRFLYKSIEDAGYSVESIRDVNDFEDYFGLKERDYERYVYSCYFGGFAYDEYGCRDLLNNEYWRNYGIKHLYYSMFQEYEITLPCVVRDDDEEKGYYEYEYKYNPNFHNFNELPHQIKWHMIYNFSEHYNIYGNIDFLDGDAYLINLINTVEDGVLFEIVHYVIDNFFGDFSIMAKTISEKTGHSNFFVAQGAYIPVRSYEDWIAGRRECKFSTRMYLALKYHLI